MDLNSWHEDDIIQGVNEFNHNIYLLHYTTIFKLILTWSPSTYTFSNQNENGSCF